MLSYSPVLNNDPGGCSPSVNSSHRSVRRRSSRVRKEMGTIGQASWASSVINLLNTILGAGVLAMPLALSRMGILVGILVIMWSALAAGFGLYLQTRCARYLERGSSSYFALSQITYPNVAVVFDAAIVVKCFGVGVSYLIVIGDLMPGVVRGFSENAWGFTTLLERRFWITAVMLVVIPISFLRRLDSLKYTSVIALISIGYLIILVVAHFAEGDTVPHRSPLRVLRWESGLAVLSTLPVIVFAYTCHQNMFAVLNEINNNSHFMTTSVIVTSVGVAYTIYVLVGVTGYISFGNDIAGNIVAMYPPSLSATIGKAAIVLLVLFSYPLQVHPCRASIDAVLRWRPTKNSDSPGAQGSRNSLLMQPGKSCSQARDGMSNTRFAAITTTISVLGYITAISVSSLETVLAYVGSTGSTSISFILPGLFYYKISSPGYSNPSKMVKEDDDDDDEEFDGNESQGLLGGVGLTSSAWRKSILRKLSLGMVMYGVVVMITCLVTNVAFAAVH